LGLLKNPSVLGLFKNVQMQDAQKAELRGVYKYTLSSAVCSATQQMSVRVPFRAFQQPHIMFSFGDQATAWCYPKDNRCCWLSCIPGKDEPSSRFRHAGQSATSARFDYSRSKCLQHHSYENDSFLHRSIS
jgi:hypothetical protein